MINTLIVMSQPIKKNQNLIHPVFLSHKVNSVEMMTMSMLPLIKSKMSKNKEVSIYPCQALTWRKVLDSSQSSQEYFVKSTRSILDKTSCRRKIWINFPNSSSSISTSRKSLSQRKVPANISNIWLMQKFRKMLLSIQFTTN